MSSDGKDATMGGVTSGTVLAVISFAMWVLAKVVVEVFGEGGCVAGDFAALKTVPDGDALLVGV